MATPGALASVDYDLIVARIGAGEYQSYIARQLGVSPQSLHSHISKHPDYRLALRCRNERKLDDAQAALDSDPDLARARERFRAAAWRAGVECPDEWGQRAQLDVNVDIGPVLQAIADRVRERVVSEQQSSSAALPNNEENPLLENNTGDD